MKRRYLFLFLGAAVLLLAGLFMKSRISGMISQAPWPSSQNITAIRIKGIFTYSLVRENPAKNDAKGKTWFVTQKNAQAPLPPGLQSNIDQNCDQYYALADVGHLQRLLALLQSARPVPVEPPTTFPEAPDKLMRVSLRDDNSHEWLLELAARPLAEEKKDMLTVLASYDGGEPIALEVESRFGELVRKPVNWYTDLRLFSIRQDNISRFEILWPLGETWSIERNRDGAFAFAKPERLLWAEVPQASTEYVLHSITTLQNAELFTNIKPMQLSSPYIGIRLWAKGDDISQELLIYRLKSEGEDDEPAHNDFSRADFGWGEIFLAYSSRQNGFFIIPADRVAALGKSLSALRSRPLLQGVLKDVGAATLTVWDRSGRTRHFSFMRRGDSWYDAMENTPIVGMETLIWRLGAMQGESDFLENADALSDPARRALPLVRWEFATQNGPVVLEFRTGNGSRPRYWVLIGDKEPWYAVSSTFVSEMLSHLPAPDAGAKARENAAREAERYMQVQP